MKPKPTDLILRLSLAIVLCAFTSSFASDNVEMNVYRTLQLDETPLDMAVTPDGRRIFVLTDRGEILVYSSAANIEAKIDVGRHVDQIKLGPGGIRSF